MQRPKPWHYKAVELAIALNYPDDPGALAQIAGEVGKAPRQLAAMLATPWAQGQIAAFHQAVVERLKHARLEPAVRLAEHRDEAATVLVEAMQLAREAKDPKAMRECAMALLSVTGDGPIQRKQVDNRHVVANLSDPRVLDAIMQNPRLAEHIARTGEVPALQ